MHPYIRVYLRLVCTHTCMHMMQFAQACKNTCMHAYVHTGINCTQCKHKHVSFMHRYTACLHVYTCVQACIPVCMHVLTHIPVACMHAHMCASCAPFTHTCMLVWGGVCAVHSAVTCLHAVMHVQLEVIERTLKSDQTDISVLGKNDSSVWQLESIESMVKRDQTEVWHRTDAAGFATSFASRVPIPFCKKHLGHRLAREQRRGLDQTRR